MRGREHSRHRRRGRRPRRRARAGCARRRRRGDRARRRARRQDARRRGRRRQIDVGPTVFTMRWVFEELFAAAGAAFADIVTLRRAERLARHFWARRLAARPLRRHRGSAEAIRDFAGAARGAGLPRLRARAERAFTRPCDASFIRASRAEPARSSSRGSAWRRPRRDLLAISPFADSVGRARRAFPRSPPAANVRALCDLLRLLAVPRLRRR